MNREKHKIKIEILLEDVNKRNNIPINSLTYNVTIRVAELVLNKITLPCVYLKAEINPLFVFIGDHSSELVLDFSNHLFSNWKKHKYLFPILEDLFIWKQFDWQSCQVIRKTDNKNLICWVLIIEKDDLKKEMKLNHSIEKWYFETKERKINRPHFKDFDFSKFFEEDRINQPRTLEDLTIKVILKNMTFLQIQNNVYIPIYLKEDILLKYVKNLQSGYMNQKTYNTKEIKQILNYYKIDIPSLPTTSNLSNDLLKIFHIKK